MIRRAAHTLSILLLAAPLLAQQAKQGQGFLDSLVVNPPANWVGTDLVDADALGANVPATKAAAFDRFRAAAGGSWTMFHDRVSGSPALIEGSGVPWIPGSGNQLSYSVDGQARRVEAARDVPVETMVERALAFVDANPDLLGVRRGDLTVIPGATGPVLDYLYFVHFQWRHHDVPVEHAQVFFRVNHGNLVQIGSDFVGDAIQSLDPEPNVTLKQAWGIADAYAQGRGADAVVDGGHLVVMPISAYPIASPGLEAAPPIAYRLVWVLAFRRPGVMGTWEARVDAHTGEIVSFTDTNAYGSIQGGTYTTDKNPTQTEVMVPFSNADYGAGLYADGGGVFPGTSGTCTMSGRYVDINDTCGSISLAANGSGLINFGTSGGTNCTTPGVGGNGNTHSARTQYWNLDAIKTKARTYLPSNSWLQQSLTANVNLNQTCNAYWNGSTVNFFRSGGGCGNTGELPGVSMHEWGHGMDQNDGLSPSNSGSGESYGDCTGVLQTHQSCLGGGFLGGNCSGYGNACTNCTGVRDIDYTKHTSGNPSTPLGWSSSCPSSGCTGPCGRECHCESLPSSEAMWDLSTRDLITWGLDQASAWQLVDKLWYASRPTAGSFYGCSNNSSCSGSNMFAVFRVADDCDGNLANGTPHATAIFAAFSRHQIACTSVTNTDNNCSCPSVAAPVVTGTPGNNANTLNWGAIAGAASYDIYRNQVSCAAGYTKIGNTTSTSYTDTQAINGFTYYYRVQARPSTSTCPPSAMSNCVTLTPASGPFGEMVPASPTQTSDSGDNDGYPDNCESINVSFQVRNSGAGTLTNARVTSITSTAGAVTVTTSFPIALGNINAGQSVNSAFTYTLDGATCGQVLDFTMTVTGDNMGGNSTANFSFTAEQDVTLVALVTYSFETNLEGWTVQSGTFSRSSTYGGSAGSFALVSSANLDNQCDVVRSPILQPTASSTLTVGTHYDIEPFSGGQWWDRANFSAWDGTTRTVLTPTGGRLYNASGVGGTCSLDTDPGWADAATTWANSSGFNLAAFAGQNIQLEVRYGTDPAANGTGFHFDNVRVTNVMALSCDTQSNTCSSCPTITVNPSSLPAGTVGTSYSQTITASGGTAPYTYAVTAGSLPTGLSLSSGGALTGTPTASGTFNFTVTATDNAGCTGTRAYSVVVNPASCPTITLAPPTLPSGTVGTGYNQTITASGGAAPYTFAVTAGALPGGLSLSSAGALTGTPTAAGTFNFTVTATDQNGCTGNRAYSIVVNPASCPTITLSPTTLPGGTVGSSYSQTITATGGAAPYTFAVTAGALPGGLSLSSGGALTGTPTAAGTFNFTVTATDQNGCTGNRAYSIIVNPSGCGTITITPATLPDGVEGIVYNVVLSASGGAAPYTWAVTSGALPTGVSLNGSTGVLSGTPSVAGAFGFDIVATDQNGCSGFAALRSGSIAPTGTPDAPQQTFGMTVWPAVDTVVGEGLGQPNGNGVKVYTRAGAATAVSFAAYGAGQWGTNVSTGDINGGSYAEILTGPGPGPGYGPQVRAFDRNGTALGKVNFYAYSTLKYGTNVAAGDVDGDSFDEMVSGAGPGAVFGPHVRGFNFDGASVMAVQKINFFAYSTLKFGVNVAGGDVDGDGYGEALTGPGPGAIFGPQVRGFNYDGATLSSISKINFNAFALAGFGVNVAAGDVEGDGYGELLAAPGPGPSHPDTVAGYDYDGASVAPAPGLTVTPFTSPYGGRVGAGDLTADGGADVICGPGRAPSAPAIVKAYDYGGASLTQLSGTPFTAFGGAYGVNVSGGALGHF